MNSPPKTMPSVSAPSTSRKPNSRSPCRQRACQYCRIVTASRRSDSTNTNSITDPTSAKPSVTARRSPAIATMTATSGPPSAVSASRALSASIPPVPGPTPSAGPTSGPGSTPLSLPPKPENWNGFVPPTPPIKKTIHRSRAHRPRSNGRRNARVVSRASSRSSRAYSVIGSPSVWGESSLGTTGRGRGGDHSRPSCSQELGLIKSIFGHPSVAGKTRCRRARWVRAELPSSTSSDDRWVRHPH